MAQNSDGRPHHSGVLCRTANDLTSELGHTWRSLAKCRSSALVRGALCGGYVVANCKTRATHVARPSDAKSALTSTSFYAGAARAAQQTYAARAPTFTEKAEKKSRREAARTPLGCSKIETKTIQNRSGKLERSGAFRGCSSTLWACSGDTLGCSRDAPGRSWDVPSMVMARETSSASE